VLEKVDDIVSGMLTILNMTADQADAVTFSSIKQNSVDATGTVTTSSTSPVDVSAASAALASGLSSSATLGGFPVSSVSVVTNGFGMVSSTSNVPLIVGLSVGLGLLLIISNFLVI
jgi:hypothetical protein